MEALRREHDQYEAFYRSVPKTMALFIGSLLFENCSLREDHFFGEEVITVGGHYDFWFTLGVAVRLYSENEISHWSFQQ